MRFKLLIIIIFLTGSASLAWCQSNDTLLLKDIQSDPVSPASQKELQIPSAGSLLQGVLYKANGPQKHPTLLILKGYPGNEKNIDLAQVVRARGWNVIYFDYRGSWGSQGQFSFANCVEDVINVVAFCNKYADSLQVDTTAISLFGHSMGGWVCLKALQRLPAVKKGFALSTWNIYGSFENVHTTEEFNHTVDQMGKYFVLNTPPDQIFTAVINNRDFYKLSDDGARLATKQVVMLDEHTRNRDLAERLKKENHAYFDYEIWQTDHPFTNKRISLIKKVIVFLQQ